MEELHPNYPSLAKYKPSKEFARIFLPRFVLPDLQKMLGEMQQKVPGEETYGFLRRNIQFYFRPPKPYGTHLTPVVLTFQSHHPSAQVFPSHISSQQTLRRSLTITRFPHIKPLPPAILLCRTVIHDITKIIFECDPYFAPTKVLDFDIFLPTAQLSPSTPPFPLETLRYPITSVIKGLQTGEYRLFNIWGQQNNVDPRQINPN